MPRLIFPKSAAFGAVVEVQLGLDQVLSTAHLHAGLVAPMPARCKMLIDTGADRTTVHQSVVASWKLTGGSFALVQTNSTAHARQQFDFSFAVLDAQGNPLVTLDPLTISLTNTQAYVGTPFLGLVGRDVLDRGEFVYGGVNSLCTLTF